MPWGAILGGGVGTLLLAFAVVGVQKLTERAVDNRTKMADFEHALDRKLESHKSDPDISQR